MPSGSRRRPGCSGSRCAAGGVVLPRDDLVQALGLHEPERGGELAHAEVQARRRRGRACRSCGRRARARAGPGGARRACRPRRSRPSWSRRTTRRRRRPTCPGGGRATPAPCACAQSSIRKMPSRAAERGDPLDLERDVAADVHEERRARPVARDLRLEVGERHAEVVAVAVDERRPRAPACSAASGVAMNVFDGHSTVSPAHAGEVERGERGARPARRTRPRRGRSTPPTRPRTRCGQRALRPALGVDDLVPQRVQPRAVARVEADREAVERRAGGRRRPRATRGRPPEPGRPAHPRRRRPAGERRAPRTTSPAEAAIAAAEMATRDDGARGRGRRRRWSSTRSAARGARSAGHAKPAGEQQRQQQHERRRRTCRRRPCRGRSGRAGDPDEHAPRRARPRAERERRPPQQRPERAAHGVRGAGAADAALARRHST